MKNYFTISELCIVSDAVPQAVADKLLQHHILPMNQVRHKLAAPIWASQKAGYRPRAYEISKGRSGNSQHCFLNDSKGAIDWTTKGDIQEMIALIIEHTDYTRICYYPNNNFVHCDYKHPDRGRRYFVCHSPTSKWEFQRNL